MVENVKNEVTEQETNHVLNILKILVNENINIKNLHLKKNKLNKIIATYTKQADLPEESTPKIIEGIIEGLSKK